MNSTFSMAIIFFVALLFVAQPTHQADTNSNDRKCKTVRYSYTIKPLILFQKCLQVILYYKIFALQYVTEQYQVNFYARRIAEKKALEMGLAKTDTANRSVCVKIEEASWHKHYPYIYSRSLKTELH
jgi:hypothetical protein